MKTPFMMHISHNTPTTYPSGAVHLNSRFYIKRPPIEEKAVAEIRKPGALIRIQSPKGMGKTSLLLRVLDHAVAQDDRTVTLDFAQIDCVFLSSLDSFLLFLCASTAHHLHLEPKLDEYWDTEICSKVACSLYFRCYLLEHIDSPIVLAFDNFDRIFRYPDVAGDVLALLLSWYGDARRTPIWQKLRLMISYSTDIYIPLKLYQNPFNVGLHIQLKDFNRNQIEKLAEKYQLNWQQSLETEKLVNLVGGQPALIQIALYHLCQKEISLAELLETATDPEGIYHQHLCNLGAILQQEPELADVFKVLVQTNTPLQLKPIIVDKLSGMGLVKQIGGNAIVNCELYRSYSAKKFFSVLAPIN